MRRLIYILLFFVRPATAQEMTYAYADSLTYAQYRAHDFAGLKQTVHEALGQGIDFFYLRMRAGILAYEKHRYEYAIPHFEKAQAMNPADTLITEYLYYSYVFAGRITQALEYAAVAPEAFREKVKYAEKKMETVSVTAGALLTDNIAANENSVILNPEDMYSQSLFSGNMLYGSVLAQGRTTNRLRLYGGVSVFSTNSLGVVQTPFAVQQESLNNEHVQGNFALDYAFGKNKDWTLSAGLGFYRVNKSELTLVFDSANPGPPHTEIRTQTMQSPAGVVSLARRFRYVQPVIGIAAARLGGTRQFQAEAGLALFPTGSSGFYVYGSAAYLKNGNNAQTVFTGKIGGRISDRLWFETTGSFGDMSNYIASNGFLVYNTFDPVKMNLGADLRIRAGKLEIIPGYRFQQRERSVLHFSSPDVSNATQSDYYNHILTTSFLWKF
ncbi:MAG: hypothetical protein FD123_131 [Bacteroidetes bacterium]|nr:MAG: hypothetical protein FD123_131 [Bacteroidota bacterium]